MIYFVLDVSVWSVFILFGPTKKLCLVLVKVSQVIEIGEMDLPG